MKVYVLEAGLAGMGVFTSRKKAIEAFKKYLIKNHVEKEYFSNGYFEKDVNNLIHNGFTDDEQLTEIELDNDEIVK